MAYKVLVVDDSSFFRRRVTEILSEDKNLEVIDVAVNGNDAVEKAISLKPDVITMDIEMPVLNGIEAVKQIMAKSPTAILMFSSLTHQGAKATLDAIDAGALDFLPKKFNEIAKKSEDAANLLRQRVVQLARRKGGMFYRTNTDSKPKEVTVQKNVLTESRLQNKKEVAVSSLSSHRRSEKEYKLLAIGTSTGGPIALQNILTKLPSDFPIPIILIQHMPATFTDAFSNRLNSLCKITIKEAADGDVLKPGCAYLAPGGRQMIIEGNAKNARIKVIEDNSERIAFKPSVDISFGSAAKTFTSNVLAVVLTGMGADGRDGSRLLKAKGSTIWTQDEASCVVYGMPQAVVKAGLSEAEFSIDSMPAAIVKEVTNG